MSESDTLKLMSRETAFNDNEFSCLARNADGDIIDLSLAYPFITEAQRERLTGDDQSRMDDYDEEARVLFAQAKEELGL
ncbi:hypothetical protein vBCbaSRXM_16 [Citromicrobium phage vB_CbaS-RXM]|nr:hypothetical protein vBCbaSRXM_16 [Citromicrobium phage vB_CbaS-RXM]